MTAQTPLPTSSVQEVMRELARLGIYPGKTRRAAERIVNLVDRTAVKDAVAADCYQLALSKIVDAADNTVDNGGPAFDRALKEARELLQGDPGREAG